MISGTLYQGGYWPPLFLYYLSSSVKTCGSTGGYGGHGCSWSIFGTRDTAVHIVLVSIVAWGVCVTLLDTQGAFWNICSIVVWSHTVKPCDGQDS